MSTVQVIPLKNAGDSITIGVESCKLMEMGKYPEVEFTGHDGSNQVAVRVPKASCDRQMDRLSLASGGYNAFEGKIVTISRDPNRNDASKPYWGIKLAGSAPKPNGTPTIAFVTRSLPDEPPPIEEAYAPDTQTRIAKTLDALHTDCFDHALELGLKAHKRGITVTGADISALCAQLFIAATSHR